MLDSTKIPAFTYKSTLYPASFKGKVPKTIRLLESIWLSPVLRLSQVKNALIKNNEYEVITNSHGMVFIETDTKTLVHIKPHKYIITSWYE